MYTHTPMVLQQTSQHSQHQSTARIRVPSGPFGLAEQELLFEHFFQNIQAGRERLESIRFDNQSAAIFCVHAIKYYSIPSVPCGLEGGKTRPQCDYKDFEHLVSALCRKRLPPPGWVEERESLTHAAIYEYSSMYTSKTSRRIRRLGLKCSKLHSIFTIY